MSRQHYVHRSQLAEILPTVLRPQPSLEIYVVHYRSPTLLRFVVIIFHHSAHQLLQKRLIHLSIRVDFFEVLFCFR